MSAGIEVVDIIDRWLEETLVGDTTLSTLVGGRITGDEYPAEWSGPIVTFKMSSTRDVLGVGGTRIAVWSIYTVKVIGEGSTYASLRPAMARVDALLHNASQTTVYGHVESTREGVIRYPEALAGVRYRHLGAMYRIHAAT